MRRQIPPARHPAQRPSKRRVVGVEREAVRLVDLRASPASAPSSMSMTAPHRWQTRWAWPVLAQVVEGRAVAGVHVLDDAELAESLQHPVHGRRRDARRAPARRTSIRSSAVRWPSVSSSTPTTIRVGAVTRPPRCRMTSKITSSRAAMARAGATTSTLTDDLARDSRRSRRDVS